MNPVEQNQIAFARERFRLPGHTVFEKPYALWGVSSRPAGHSCVTACRFDADKLHSQIDRILREYQKVGSPANWTLGPCATPDDLGKILRRERRFMGPMYLPGMELDLKKWKAGKPEHPSYRVEDWEPIIAQQHPWSLWVPKAARADTHTILQQLQALGNTHNFVCHVGGWLASAATVFIADGIAGIYDVVTKNEYRRQHGATAVLTEALSFARDHGCHVAILQSHKKAASLYARLGFVETCMFTVMYYSRARAERDAAAASH